MPSASATPAVSLPTGLEATPGGQVVVAVDIAGVADAGIGSYAIRLDYDDTVLSNPTAVDTGTLSEGNANLQEPEPNNNANGPGDKTPDKIGEPARDALPPVFALVWSVNVHDVCRDNTGIATG